MRIPSGSTDRYIYFVAVDSTDLKTRETGLSSFTVYRSRNGAAAAAMTTPTINEVDATNMPGVYELLLDEDTTLGAGNDAEELCLHITQASMAPVTRVVEIYRPETTEGNTLGVESDGDATKVNTLNGHTPQTADHTSAISTIDGIVDSILVDTAEIGVAGAGLTEAGGDGDHLTAIADAVWDEARADHVTAGTFGEGVKAESLNTQAKADANAEVDQGLSDFFTSSAQLVDDIWDEQLTGGTHNVSTSAGRRLRELAAANIRSGTAQAGSSNSITLDSGASATDEIYDNNLIVIVGGTGIGQSRLIVEYDGSTKVAIVDQVWQTNPDATSEFQILADHQGNVTHHGIAQAGTANTITLATTASSQDDVYNDQIIYLSTSSGTGQARRITDYNGTSKVATVSPDWQVNPTSNSVYKILPAGRVDVDEIEGTDATDQIRDAIVDDATRFSGADIANILADTNELQGDWADGGRLDLILDARASQASVDTIDGIVDSILVDTGTTIPNQISGLNDPTASAIASAVLAAGDVDGYSLEETLKICLAALAAKLSGAATSTITIRAADDSKDRITATVDADGNRSAVVLDETG